MNPILIDTFTELAMMLAALVAGVGTYIYIFRYNNRRWLCYMQLIAIIAIFTIYLLLFCDLEPLNSDLNMRSQVIRIVLFFFLTSFGFDRMNGRISRWYNKFSTK